MIRISFQLLFLLLLPVMTSAQSVTISPTSETADNGSSVLSLSDGAKVSIDSRTITFLDSGSSGQFSALGFSPDRSVVSLLNNVQGKARVTLLTASGDTLNRYSSISLSSSDPSLGIYPTNGGHLLLRNNIMNFTFHDESGNIGTNISNGSNSEQGETISQLVMNPTQETILLYTSKIKREGQVGSKIRLVDADRKLQYLYQSDDRYIKDLDLSGDGTMVSFVTAASGTSDRVVVMDKYGNQINSISAENQLQGATLSADNSHLTLFSENRIRVYNVLTGENMGSTSLQEPVFMAEYVPEDQMLLIVSGNFSTSSSKLSNIEVKAVDLGRRDITSTSYSGRLTFHESLRRGIQRLSSNNYRLTGANKELNIEVSF
ncbi:hypothetical protein [Fodinibius sediminis]|uniref:WD40-like Beta Propeller Repeat n=1 Tax=Fodinibius sediminis TaxID=1214077 RepID=A0A521BAA6_9BACT|nr:hypothetical protein [Fodinibius sediminis]SMO43951.1 hypothetical protein SAMN06265218_102340 [Fodinibius sediminis]